VLEWLLRKIFPGWLKKPASDQGLASEGLARQQKDSDNTKATKTGHETKQPVEPSLDMASVQPLVPKDDTHTKAVPFTAVPPPTIEGSVATPQLADENSTKVHIFNFHAWFYADPVKAALTLGLAFLSWLATYTGMLELIQANTGSLDIGARVAIAFAVMMLMLMILYLLDSLYSGGTPTWIKPFFVFGYLFLTLISVGFGFGFYWKYLEAQTEATRSAESAVSQVQVALQIGQTRLEQLQSTFTQLTALSIKKATQEREHGNSCPNSKPGEGPRMRLRDSDSQKFGYAAEYITGRANSVKGDLTALNGDLKKVVSRDASTVGADGTRNKFLRALGRKLDLTIARFNTLRTDPQLLQFRDNFDKRAGTTVFPTGRGGTFRCPDVQLQTALRGVVRAIDDIPEIKNPKIAAVEGSEAIVEAFRRLAVTLAALPTLKLPPSPEELRKARKQAISAGRKVEVSNIDPGLSKRDYIPLSAAVFVDLCILLISLNRRYNNFEKLQRSVASAKAGEVGNTVLDIFEAHKNKISQEMLEIFHHAEFEYGRDYYLAVPLIKGSKKALLNERLHAKQDEISRSQHEALDHKISILDAKLQKLNIERSELESMKLQMTNHKNRLMAKNKGYNDQSFMEQFAKLDRLMNGNFQRIQQSKVEVGLLKEQRTTIHKQDEKVLRGQLEVSDEHDLAKEARFLSNLCISLEANNILHLASIYPFQSQVRSRLKKHSSRYYAKDRHYRVYRFRKVADTQSQMVLDLIMEASKRARANGELVETDAPVKIIEASVGKALSTEHETIEPPELVALKSEQSAELKEMREIMLGFKSEAASKQAEIDSLKQEAANTPAPPIDRDAMDAVIVENLRKPVTPEARSAIKRHLEAQKNSFGLGVASEDLANLDKKDIADAKEPVAKQSDEILVARAEIPEITPEELAKSDKSPRNMAKLLGGIFSPKSRSSAEQAQELEIDEVIEEKEPIAKLVDRLPAIAVQEPSAKVEPEVEAEPFVAIAPEPVPVADEPRGRVNEESLLPPVPATPPLPKSEELSISVSLGEDDHKKRDQSLARLSRLKNLDTLVQKLDREKGPDSPVEATRTNVFTDPVILGPGDSSQDPVDKLLASRPVSRGPLTYEPSEADKFEEGAIPGFLRGKEVTDEVSEEISIQNMAKRFGPTKKDQ
jgi:hypothetical protein